MDHGTLMKKLFLPLAFSLLLPTAAIAQLDPEVADQCKDARDFYGCVKAFTTPARRTNDVAPLAGAMGQVAAGLITGPNVRNSASNFPTGFIPSELIEGILRDVLR